jgi:hypothetical protein
MYTKQKKTWVTPVIRELDWAEVTGSTKEVMHSLFDRTYEQRRVKVR